MPTLEGGVQGLLCVPTHEGVVQGLPCVPIHEGIVQGLLWQGHTRHSIPAQSRVQLRLPEVTPSRRTGVRVTFLGSSTCYFHIRWCDSQRRRV